MTKLISIIKLIGYCCSVVLPLLDAAKGVRDGIKKAIAEKEYEKECIDIYKFIEENENIDLLEKTLGDEGDMPNV